MAKRRSARSGSTRTAGRTPARTKKKSAARKPAAKRAARPAARTTAKRPASRTRAQANPRTSAPANTVPNGIGLVLHHLDFTTHAQDEVRRFYVEVLGFSQSEFDAKQNYLLVQTAPGASLGFMPPMPGPPEDWRPPREPAIYFFVTDVDRAYRDLSAKGVSFDGEPADAPWGHRVALLRDPEGRRICLAQPLTARR